MKKILLPFFTVLALSLGAFAQVNITFELNAATIKNIDPNGLYVAGGSGMGVPGDNQLTDEDNDGIYTITVQRDKGFSSYFTFLNGNCGDWSCKENLAGLPCGDPSNFNDRFLPRVTQDTTIKACFGTCDNDGGCTLVLDSINITFELNTADITVDEAGVFLAGGGNFGNPGDNPMIDPDQDGIYTITVRKAVGFTSNYTFANGACADFSCKEDIEGLACADAANYNDRKLPKVFSDTTIKACFGNCVSDGTCESVGIFEKDNLNTIFTLQPTVVSILAYINFNDENNRMPKTITVFNTAGVQVLNTSFNNSGSFQLNVGSLPNGLYFLNVSTNTNSATEKFIISK